MRHQDGSRCARWRRRWQGLQGSLLLALWLASPLVAWAQEGGGLAPGIKVLPGVNGLFIEEDLLQEGGGLAPGIKVLAALQVEGPDLYAWSPDGKRLAYMAADGIWVVEAPDFRQPKLLIREGRGRGGSSSVRRLLWSPNGQKLAFTDSRPADEWETIWVADADGSHVRDLLFPPGTPSFVGQMPSGGSRTVVIGFWLNNREIEFWVDRSGGYILDTERGTYRGDPEEGPLGGGGLVRAPTEHQDVSPDGQWLALWHPGRFGHEGDVGSGLEPFLPPVGKEDAALSDAEIIERYFQKVLAVAPENCCHGGYWNQVLGGCTPPVGGASPPCPDAGYWSEFVGAHYARFLRQYTQTLVEMGKVEAAEEQYRKAIELAQKKGMGIEVMHFYVFFLCEQGRGKEAAEVIASVPALRQLWERGVFGRLEDFLAGLDLGAIGQFWERDFGRGAESPYGEGKKAEAQGGPEPAPAPPPAGARVKLVGCDLEGCDEPRPQGPLQAKRESCLEMAVHAAEPATAPPPPVPQQLPSLYIVKVPEKGE